MIPQRLLILGGTGEAASLARGVVARFADAIELTTALAGRTIHPGPLPGLVRIGGFGGTAGLALYLKERSIDCVIDATHPFAAEISASARQACDNVGVRRLMLVRPPWRRHPLDRWIEVDGIEAAAAIVARVGQRAWLTSGASSIQAFALVHNVQFLVRLVDPPQAELPLRQYQVVIGRGPFSLTEERHLLQRHAIDVLVCKASGGGATEAKLIAARELSLPVIMVRRPRPEPGQSVDTIDAALDWLAGSGAVSAARRMS
jgi:precorrin-6A/cobalt-precorrin-6A reductase